MAAISQKIFSLIGGVSQQPDTIKSGSQLRICDNYYPDTATGLTKRPGLRGISKLANAVADGTWFPIFRDDEEKYIIQFSKAGALKIWSANSGLQQTVNAVAAEATAYAVHTQADELQTLQINDYIFVLNRKREAAAGSGTIAAQTPYAFVSINTVAYNSTYSITLDGVTFSYATPVTTSTTTPQLNVADIINNLVGSINANANYTAQGIGNIIHVRRTNNGDFAITARGGNTGTSIDAYKGSVTSVAQLPKQFINNLKIKVSGSADSGADDYWVVFKTSNNGGSGTGTWEETIAPGVIFDFNEETMPHVIIREANGTFTYRQLDEASAGGSTGPTSVTGIVTGVVVNGTTSGGHVVGEQFSVTGGTGANLRLQVDRIQSLVNTTSTAANSGTYVRNVPPPLLFLFGRFGSTGGFGVYNWFVNGVQIGTTTSPVLSIGNTLYTVNGSFVNISNQLRAGVTTTVTTTGVIDAVSIVQAGQGYTETNIVQNAAGDTFTITAVNTAPLEGDASRLNYWKYREVGDNETNPMPSFVGYPIDAISFYKNRIVFTSRQNVICSQAGDYFNFFASTVITIVDSDPIDISASSLKPIRLKHAIPAPRGLLLFGDNAQFILETTTEAFSPKTAEINLISSFSQTDRIAPLDIGSSYLFLEEGVKASSIYEMALDSGGGKPAVIELTRFIPTYIPSAVLDMQVSQSAGTMALLSKQEVSSLYLYRWFQNGDTRISGWFRWMLPGTIEFFTFDHDILFVVTKHGSNYVLSRMSLLTDTPSESLLFEGQYLDVRLDLFDYNPTLTYDSVADLTHICFKDGFEDSNEQPVLIYLNPDVAGYFEEQTLQYDATKPTGQKYFLTVDGDQTASKFAVGYKYEALAQLPAFYFVRDEARGSKDTVNIPRVSRIKVNSYNSGPYRAVVRTEGRNEFSLTLPQINADYYLANNVPIIRNAQSTIPIMAKGTQFEFELIADAPFQTAFTSIDWEGTYDNKGIQSL